MRVLICDDEPSIRLLFRSAIEQPGVEVIEAATVDACLTAAAEARPDAVILDVFLPGCDGLSAIPELTAQLPDAPVFVVSAHASRETFDQAVARGAAACFEKLRFLEAMPEILRGPGASV